MKAGKEGTFVGVRKVRIDDRYERMKVHSKRTFFERLKEARKEQRL